MKPALCAGHRRRGNRACDIAGKLAGAPLWKLYGGSTDCVPVYASGINPTSPEVIAAAALDAGYQALKLKIGFGTERDTRNLAALRDLLGDDGQLMADANQAWDVGEASAMLDKLAPFNLAWLEEPIAADRPESEWRSIRDLAGMPLAAGENVQGMTGLPRGCGLTFLVLCSPTLPNGEGCPKQCRWRGR